MRERERERDREMVFTIYVHLPKEIGLQLSIRGVSLNIVLAKALEYAYDIMSFIWCTP